MARTTALPTLGAPHPCHAGTLCATLEGSHHSSIGDRPSRTPCTARRSSPLPPALCGSVFSTAYSFFRAYYGASPATASGTSGTVRAQVRFWRPKGSHSESRPAVWQSPSSWDKKNAYFWVKKGHFRSKKRCLGVSWAWCEVAYLKQRQGRTSMGHGFCFGWSSPRETPGLCFSRLACRDPGLGIRRMPCLWGSSESKLRTVPDSTSVCVCVWPKVAARWALAAVMSFPGWRPGY